MIVVPENDPQGERHTMAAELACQVTGSSPAQACLLLLGAGVWQAAAWMDNAWDQFANVCLLHK